MNRLYIWIQVPDMVFFNTYLVGGFNPSEKYELANWDDDIPNISGKISQSCSSHHQPVV